MDPVVISAQCGYTVPRTVIVGVMGPDGIIQYVAFNEAQYAILALLPGFPADPCAGT